MNLIEESFQNKEQKKKSRAKLIILISIGITLLIIIGISIYLAYIQSTMLRLTLDGVSNNKLKELLVIEENGTIYMPIRQVAEYFGYDSFGGEYSAKSESTNKCYVQSEKEVANFSLGSNKIYKLDLSSENENYEYVYIKQPIKAIGGQLYATEEGIEQAFNLSIDYNKDTNRITIYTLPYLINGYSSYVLDYGYTQISELLVNQKAVLNNMLVVLKEDTDEQYGVIDTEGNTVLEPKYDNITYIPETGDFLVESNGKVGIISKSKETKVQITYDSIELMDKDTGLYVVEKEGKYGVIDIRGNIKIYIENDQIGIDLTKFKENDIKNKYLLIDNLIPVKKGELWGLYNKNGNKVVDFEYNSFGYIASNNKNATNLLIIPNYNVLVACKDSKYTLINSSGEKLFEPRADDIYMTISGGAKHYYIAVNDRTWDAEEFLDQIGVKPITNTNSNTTNTTGNEENNTNSNNSSDQTKNQNVVENNQENDTQNNQEGDTQNDQGDETQNNEENNGNGEENQ